MSTLVPPLLAGLIDDAAVFPPGNATLGDALAAHHRYRAADYRDLVGPLLVPATALDGLAHLVEPARPVRVGLIADTGLAGLPAAVSRLDQLAGVELVQVEIAVAKRGEDPAPGLRRLLELVANRPGLAWYAELPLTFGLHSALDTVATARRAGVPVAAKFRTGGLAAELFPSPPELAAVLCAARDRDLPIKLTAGLHRAIRYTDAPTGFTHHGFLNVLAACLTAAGGAGAGKVAAVLAGTDPAPVVATIRPRLAERRPLWIGYGSCDIAEPLADLRAMGLIAKESA